MVKKLYEEDDIRNIANSIRRKSGTTNSYKVSEISNAIDNISSGLDGVMNNTFNDSTLQYVSLYARCLKKVLPVNNSNFTPNALQHAFYYYTSLDDISECSNWDITNITSLRSSFFYCTSVLNWQPIVNWNTTNVTDMYNTFYGTKMTTLELNWDLTNTTNLGYFLAFNKSITDFKFVKPCSDLNNNLNMTYMFNQCVALKNVDMKT